MAASPHLRVIDGELDELLAQIAALAVEGPKGVGKTATLARRATTTFRLDEPAQKEVANADPSVLLTAATPILIDEWQHVLFRRCGVVRRAVDDDQSPSQFLLAATR